MAKTGFTNIAAAMAPLRKAATALEKRGVIETRVAGILAITTAINATPVWTGETVRNYRFGRDGVLPSGTIEGGEGEPGTNDMPLGPEKHRPAATAAAIGAAFKVLTTRKLTSFVLTNTVDAQKWDMMDNGIVPGPSPPWNHRSVGGLGRLARQAVRNGTGGLWK